MLQLSTPEGLEVLKVSDRKVYFPADLIDQSKSPSFIKALKGENYISAVFTSPQSQPYVTLAIPLWGVAQSVAGVVSAEADLSFLWEALGKIRFGTAGYAYLVDGQGNLIAHKDAALVLKRMNLKQVGGVKKFLSNPTRADTSPANEGKGLTGDPVLVTYAPVPELGWAVILEEPVDTALAEVQALRRSAILFLVVGLFVGAFVIAWVSQKITRPIQELRESVATIGAGNLEHRANIKTGDEIEELATEFNKMTNALESSYATLEQKVDQRTKEISALYSVTTAVNESLALKDILAAVIPMTTEIFQFETIRVFLFNDEGTELELQASYALNPEHSTIVHALKRGEGITGHVAATGEAMIFENLQTDPRYAKMSTTKASLNARLRFPSGLSDKDPCSHFWDNPIWRKIATNTFARPNTLTDVHVRASSSGRRKSKPLSRVGKKGTATFRAKHDWRGGKSVAGSRRSSQRRHQQNDRNLKFRRVLDLHNRPVARAT